MRPRSQGLILSPRARDPGNEVGSGGVPAITIPFRKTLDKTAPLAPFFSLQVFAVELI